MSQATTESKVTSAPPQPTSGMGRIAVVVILVAALMASALARTLVQHLRSRQNTQIAGATNASSLSSMNGFALALLLGGLRGPLVMILWSNSENLKNERNLEDFDTMVEWIRLLQPEFDSVHVFQIWNKAYNISVQMASLSNKYSAILDALDYAQSVLDQRPDDINIVTAMAQVYEQKLGTSTEKNYYIPRVRSETMPLMRVQLPAARVEELKEAVKQAGISPSQVRYINDPDGQTVTAALRLSDGQLIQGRFTGPEVSYAAVPRQSLRRGGDLQRRNTLNTMLDEQGRILPEYRNTLRHLVSFEPFDQGLSPLALGYEYYKQAQELQAAGQRHLQISEMVVDSRPAVSLRQWGEELWERGRRMEITGMGIAQPSGERLALERPTADVAPVAPLASPAQIDQAIRDYDRAIRIMDAAAQEYTRHLQSHEARLGMYLSHLDHIKAVKELIAGDRDYLHAMRSGPGTRSDFLNLAAEHYRKAVELNQLMVLQYYVDEEVLQRVLQRPGAASESVAALKQFPPQQYGQILNRVYQFYQENPGAPDTHFEDRGEYEQYIQRAWLRLRHTSQGGVLPLPLNSSPMLPLGR